MKTHEHNAHLPRWAYIALAATTAAIGLATSGVTAQFFIIGLQQLEADELARDALVAAGILMILTELAAFGLAALLPTQRLRALRWQLMACGVLLVGFEGVTIYATQVALARTSENAHASISSRIANLEQTIAAQRASAAALRAAGARDAQSKYPWIRQQSADTLRQAVAIERRMEPLSAELQKLHAQQRPTLKDALGDTGVLWYSVVRSLLISVMGLVMFGASGALLRAARSGRALPAPVAQPEATAAPGSALPQPAAAAPATVAQPHTSAAPTNALPADVPQPLFGAGVGKWQAGVAVGAAALTPVAAFAAPSPATAASVQHGATDTVLNTTANTVFTEGMNTVWNTVERGQNDHTNTVDRPVEHSAAAQQTQFDPIEPSRDARYDHLRAGVEKGVLKPSVRSLMGVSAMSTVTARRYLAQMLEEGVIVREGQGYTLAQQA